MGDLRIKSKPAGTARRVPLLLFAGLIFGAASGAAHGQSQAAASPAAQSQSAASTVQFRVVPDAGADNAAVIAPLQDALAVMRQTLGDAPASLQAVKLWSERLTAALRQGGFPVGQVLMTQGDWDAAARGQPAVFSVFPGRIGSIAVKNGTRVADARLQRLITQALCGDTELTEQNVCLLQTSRLERATQLLQDVPGVGLEGAPQIEAGQRTGEVALTVPLRDPDKPVQFGVVADNNGIPATGRSRYGATVSGNNLFHAGDNYYATAMVSDKGEWTGTAGAGMPLGASGLRLAGSLTRQQYSVDEVTAISGTSTVAQLGLQYPFTRGLDGNVWGGAWFVHNHSSTDFTDFGVGSSATIDALQLSLTANNGDRAQQLRADRWSGQAALTLGHNSNDDTSDAVTRRSGDYAKFTASAFGSIGLNHSGDLFLTGQASGQYASRNLDASERQSLGGPNAVRAYRTDEGSVDDGMIVNAGLYQRIPITAGHQLQLGVFADAAWGRVNHDPWLGWESSYVGIPGVTNIRRLAGYGVGLGWLTPVGVTVSLSASQPFGFSDTSWVETDKRPTQTWLTANWSY